MSLVENSMCNFMDEEADKILDRLENIRGTIRSSVASIESMVSSMFWSSTSEILDNINKINNSINDIVPNIDEWNDVMTVLMACDFLKNYYQSPTSVVKSISSTLLGNAKDTIVDIASIPEVIVCNMLDDLSDLLGTNVRVDLKAIQEVLVCLESLCGLDVSDKVTRLNSFYSYTSILSTGYPDYMKILSDSGITDLTKINNFTQVKNTFDNAITNVNESVDTGVDIVKTLYKQSSYLL